MHLLIYSWRRMEARIKRSAWSGGHNLMQIEFPFGKSSNRGWIRMMKDVLHQSWCSFFNLLHNGHNRKEWNRIQTWAVLLPNHIRQIHSRTLRLIEYYDENDDVDDSERCLAMLILVYLIDSFINRQLQTDHDWLIFCVIKKESDDGDHA